MNRSRTYTEPLTLPCDNTGLLVKSAGTGTASLPCDLSNTGTVRVTSGALSVSKLTQFNGNRRTLGGGTYDLTGSLRVPGLSIGTLQADVILNSAGQLTDSNTNSDALSSLSTLVGGHNLTLNSGANLTTSAPLSTSGTLSIGAGSSLQAPTVTQSDGTTTLAAATSTLNAAGGYSLNGGTLAGLGSLTGSLTNTGGTLTPGITGTPGTLSVTGSYTQASAGTAVFDLTAAGRDQLAATGSASLAGGLSLASAPGYTPARGTALRLLSFAGAATGHFSPVSGTALANGDRYCVSQPAGRLDVTPQASCFATPPTVQINGGSARTNGRTVTLTLTVPAGMTPSGMRIANDTDPTGAYTPYAASTSWQLPARDGTHTVRVQLEDNLGNPTDVGVATIILDTVAPVATITPPTSNTNPVTITFDETVTAVSTSNITLVATGTGNALPTSVTCLDATGATVPCGTGSVITVKLQPTAPLLPQTSYTVTVNPAGVTPKVHDLAGNNAAPTSRTFAL